MIDLHCHILPGLDDGAFSLDESLLMAQAAYESGTRGICCTPHSGRYSKQQLLSAFTRFKGALADRHLPLKIFLGQEIYLTSNYEKQIRDVKEGYPLTINDTLYLLIEFDPQAHSRMLTDAISLLRAEGYLPIVAHPERYGAVIEDPALGGRLKDAGALLQINKGSLKGAFGQGALNTASYLLDEEEADFVASDGHSPYERTPKLRAVHAYISEQYSIDYADHLLLFNPARVITNKPIYPYND